VITVDGVAKTASQWSRETGVHRKVIANRYRRGLRGGALFSPERMDYTAAPRRSGRGSALAPGAPGAWSWHRLEWEQDVHARALLSEFGPLTLECVGAAFGLVREAVRNIETAALVKCRAAMELVKLLGEEPALRVLAPLRGCGPRQYLAAVERARVETRKAA
jgi:hypothetical protein